MHRLIPLALTIFSAMALGQTYEAQYDMTWNVGVRLEAKATETLKKTGDLYEIVLHADASIGSVTEASNLLYSPKMGWKPLDYSYTQNLLGRTTGRHFRFNWNKDIVSRMHESEQTHSPILDGTFDPLGFRLQLAHLLKSGQPLPQKITIIDGDDFKTWEIAVRGSDLLETPMGALKTKKYSLIDSNFDSYGSFYFWLAPSLDYQLVRLEKKDNKRLLTLTLTAFQPSNNP